MSDEVVDKIGRLRQEVIIIGLSLVEVGSEGGGRNEEAKLFINKRTSSKVTLEVL